MNFGQAVELMKIGKCVCREGWNGKGMFVYLGKYENKNLLPSFVMYTTQGKFQPGWLASQADILAEDWIGVNVEVDEDFNVTKQEIVV